MSYNALVKFFYIFRCYVRVKIFFVTRQPWKNRTQKVVPENRHGFSFSGTINLGEIIGKIAAIQVFGLKYTFAKSQFQIMDN